MQFPLRRFAKGQILIYQGVEISSLYAVRSGFVKFHDSSLTGDEQLIWIAKKYDFIPLEWLFSGTKTSSFYYTALTDVEAYVVDKQEFLTYAQEHPEIMPDVVRIISDQYNDAMLLVNALQKPRAREKMIYTLNFISSRFVEEPDRREGAVTVPLTQQDLADLSGMTRATATVELKRLKDAGYIDYDKSSFSIDLPKLEALL